jgi:glutathione S-transferase
MSAAGAARTLYSGDLSLFSRKVEIALAEKGLAFARVAVPFTQSRGYSPKHPAVLAAHPKGQVPVLLDGGLTLFDSTVICEYLEDAYPTPPLYPRSAAARARCRLLELEGDEILLPPLRTLMHRSEPMTDAGKRAQQEFEAGKGEAALARQFESLERRLDGQPFFCGECLTVADIALFMSLLWAQRLKGPGPAGQPGLAAWYARLLARPAVAKVAGEIAAADRVLSPDLFR